MKRILAVVLIIMVFSTIIAGCQRKKSETNKESEEKLSIVTTIFPQYDITREIVGNHGDLTMLLKPGSESHAYEPTPQDIIKIQNSDIFIYVGGESDSWVDKILESIDTKNIRIVSLMDIVSTVEEEVKEGMDIREEELEEPEYDEHVWTNPKNVIAIANEIEKIVCELDKTNKAIYTENGKDYVKELNAIDGEIRKVIQAGKRNTIVFGDRFPLRYFVEEYQVDYWAAFPGCSSETEPSASTIAFLIDKVKEEKIPVVFKVELSNDNIANVIAESTGAKVITYYSCHNVTKEDFEKGTSYIEFMRSNIKNLQEALN